MNSIFLLTGDSEIYLFFILFHFFSAFLLQVPNTLFIFAPVIEIKKSEQIYEEIQSLQLFLV